MYTEEEESLNASGVLSDLEKSADLSFLRIQWNILPPRRVLRFLFKGEEACEIA